MFWKKYEENKLLKGYFKDGRVNKDPVSSPTNQNQSNNTGDDCLHNSLSKICFPDPNLFDSSITGLQTAI